MGLAQKTREEWDSLGGDLLFISPLSTHILFYVNKWKVPSQAATEFQGQFGIVPFTKHVLDKALEGPTDDLEDNIQLHSCAEADCDIFLTNDKQLLKMKFFGKTRILSEPASQ